MNVWSTTYTYNLHYQLHEQYCIVAWQKLNPLASNRLLGGMAIANDLHVNLCWPRNEDGKFS